MDYYADTDFILSIIKEDDWLQSQSKKILEKHKGNIETSAATFLEAMMVLKRSGIEEEPEIMQDMLSIAKPINTPEEKLFKAAYYMKEYGINTFDAFHLAMTEDRKIISSDKEFDQTQKDRIKLEEKDQ